MVRSRLLAAAAVVATGCATGVLLAPAQADATAGSVHLYRIYYNSPGTDTGSNTSLNGEWVQVTNTTSAAVNLTGWTVTDASRHVYVFSSYSVGAHQTITIDTGKGTNTATHRYQGRSWYVWNNDKDTATLKNGRGTWIDSCSYNNPRASYAWC